MSFIEGYSLQFIIFFFGWFIIAICEVIVPVIFSIMINQIIYYKNLALFLKISGLFIILIGFNAGMYYLIYQVYAYLSNMYTFKVRHCLFKQMQKLDAEKMSSSKYGDIAVMIQWQAQVCMDFIVRNIIHSFNHIFKIFFCIVIIFNISPYLALAMAILVPIVVMINVKFGRKVRKASDKQRKYYGDYIGWIFEAMQGFKDIRLLGAVPLVMDKFKKNQEKIIRTENQNKFYILSANNVIQLANVLFKVVIFIVLALLVSRSDVKIGAVIITCSYYEIIRKNMQTLSERYMDSQKRLAIIQRINDFMKLPTTDSWTGEKELDVKSGDINFHNVVFSYVNNDNVINGVNLKINHGKKYALVGKSGCGKTTLAYLLAGFYELKDGKIEVDGQDISECSLKSIHKEIGLIQQQVMQLDSSIRENIMLGNKGASEEELVQACKCAGIYDFIMSLEDGFDTMIGRFGRNLSGGQRQRIAIARIYLRNPKIIVFDEATSALDSKTEEKIHDSWKSILSNRTAIIIAHRLSSVMLCDKVAMIDNGSIKKIGTPEELYKNDKKFRKLFAIDKESVDA
ncbi:ABC transporter ATP-binding protein [Clostridium tepidiprofundi]|nr:ABC transporter ATP-binding protein [Clostridium tepidiprofundi]